MVTYSSYVWEKHLLYIMALMGPGGGRGEERKFHNISKGEVGLEATEEG